MATTEAAWLSLESFTFGDSPQMADQLLAYVLAGAKTATCWSIRDGQQTHVGKRMVVKDGAGHPRAVLETASLEQMRFDDVPWSFAAAEGEGDRNLDDWRAGHERYFARNGGFSRDMMLWCERFRLVEIIGEGTDQ
ncbi:MAG: ASCH domain-containing protein [Phenylobacterium sp.]